MTLNKFLRKCLVPAIVVGVLVYIVIVKYHIRIPQIKINPTNSKKYTSETCPNSFTQLLVRDTCYVCPEGSQGISWVSPGYVQCSTEHNTVLNAIQK
jgi:hypothetical protein